MSSSSVPPRTISVWGRSRFPRAAEMNGRRQWGIFLSDFVVMRFGVSKERGTGKTVCCRPVFRAGKKRKIRRGTIGRFKTPTGEERAKRASFLPG